jgi:hypothetical protein
MMAGVDFRVELKGLADLQRKLEGKIRRLEQRTIREAQQAFADPIAYRYEGLVHTEIPKLKVVTNIKIRGAVGWVRIGPSNDPYFSSALMSRLKSEGHTRKGIRMLLTHVGGITRLTHGMIAYWLERGFNILSPPYRSKKGGSVWCHIGANPMLANAWESQKSVGLAAFEKVMRDALEETVPD